MDNVKVSIIMPVYNAGVYFRPCIESILNQTLQDIELIVVLDKPTDGTDHLVYEYAKQDERIVILSNEENLHIGNSRNRGLSVARGKYIAFSDHDDVRELDMYERMYNIAEGDSLDILFSCPTMKYGDRIVRWEYVGDRKFLRYFLLNDLIGFGNFYRSCPSFCFLHFNLYRADLIRVNKITFVDTKRISPEDVIFNLECVYNAQNVDYVDASFYYHEEYASSTGRSLSYSGCRARLEGMNYIYTFLNQINLYELYKSLFFLYVHKEVLNSMIKSTFRNARFCDLIKNIRLFRQYPFVKEAFCKYEGMSRKIYTRIIDNFIALCLTH